MIKTANKEISDFIEYLNEKYKKVPDVYIYVIPKTKTVRFPNGEIAFAAYNSLTNTIIAAGEAADEREPERLLKNIAHEFYHHIEKHYPNDDSQEIEHLAEKFATKTVDDFLELQAEKLCE